MCMENGKVIKEKHDDSTAMKWIKDNYRVIAFIITVVWWFASANSRLFTTEEIRVNTEAHIVDKSVHRSYKEKLAGWYTRKEGIELELRLKEIEDIKIDIAIIKKAVLK